jgi:hypothetical protein
MLLSSKIILLIVALIFAFIKINEDDFLDEIRLKVQELLQLANRNQIQIEETSKAVDVLRKDFAYSTLRLDDFNEEYKRFLKNLETYYKESARSQKVSEQIQNDIAMLSTLLKNMDLTKENLQGITKSHERSIAQLVYGAESNLSECIDNAEKSMIRILNTIKQNARLNVKNYYTLEEFERDLNGN